MSTLPDRSNAPKVAPPSRWWTCRKCGLSSLDPQELCEPSQSSSGARLALGGEAMVR